jgi:type I restriction enzyme, S subunit
MIVRTVPLAFLAAIRSGGGAPQDQAAYSETGHPFVRAGSLSKLLGGADENSLEKLEPTVAAKHGLKLFPAGTVLFAKSGMSATKGYIYRLRRPAYVVNHLAAVIPHDPSDSAFLARALENFPPTSLIRDAAYPSIRLRDIEEMRIKAPTDVRQRQRIGAILDQVDELRRKRRQALDKIGGIARAIFEEMFGASTASGDVHTGALGDHLSFITSGGRNWAKYMRRREPDSSVLLMYK